MLLDPECADPLPRDLAVDSYSAAAVAELRSCFSNKLPHDLDAPACLSTSFGSKGWDNLTQVLWPVGRSMALVLTVYIGEMDSRV